MGTSPHPPVAEVVAISRSAGLATGLRRLIDHGLTVPCSAGGNTLLPAGAVPAVTAWRMFGSQLPPHQVQIRVRRHPLAAAEGLQLVNVTVRRWEPDPLPASGSLLIATLVAAVRLGLTMRMLDLAVRHLSGRLVDDRPLIQKQLPQAVIADAATTLEMCRHGLSTAASAATIAALHVRLAATGWSIATLFGASGYLRDHPTRCLYVAELVHDVWAAPADDPSLIRPADDPMER